MADRADTRFDWSWLADTYWCVPRPDLPALQLDPEDNVLSWLVDQTVWHISGYQSGYFWGVTGALTYDAGGGAPAGGPGAGRRRGRTTPARTRRPPVPDRGSVISRCSGPSCRKARFRSPFYPLARAA